MYFLTPITVSGVWSTRTYICLDLLTSNLISRFASNCLSRNDLEFPHRFQARTLDSQHGEVVSILEPNCSGVRTYLEVSSASHWGRVRWLQYPDITSFQTQVISLPHPICSITDMLSIALTLPPLRLQRSFRPVSKAPSGRAGDAPYDIVVARLFFRVSQLPLLLLHLASARQARVVP